MWSPMVFSTNAIPISNYVNKEPNVEYQGFVNEVDRHGKSTKKLQRL